MEDDTVDIVVVLLVSGTFIRALFAMLETSFSEVTPALFITVMLMMSVTALAIRELLATKIPVYVDILMDEAEAQNILGYMAIALAITSSFAVVFPPVPKVDYTSPGVGESVVIAISVAEELFFRFFMQKVLSLFMGDTAAIIVQALAFTGFHQFVYEMELPTIITIFIAGVVYGLLYAKTGRISTSMTAHIFNNFLAVLVY